MCFLKSHIDVVSQVFGPGCSLVEAEEDEGPPPAIMVYLVDPFSAGHDDPALHRLITLGLLRCYKQMLDCLPPQMQANVHVQVTSNRVILDGRGHRSTRHCSIFV